MKARNLWLIIPWTLSVAAASAWIFYWNYLAGEAERRVHAWQFEQNAGGATGEIGQVVRHGFPVFLRLELRDVRYAASRGGWRAETARADLNIDPLKPRHAILEAKAPIAITRANGAVTNVSADALIASVRMNSGADLLRGYQMTDVNGEVNFLTIFPGWYTGRVCHIHFQVYVSSSYSAVSQMTFDIATKNAIYAPIQHYIPKALLL